MVLCVFEAVQRPAHSRTVLFLWKRRTLMSNVQCRSSSAMRVQQDRLLNDIHHTSQWGTGKRWGDAPTETGMSRLSLSHADKQARDWFANETRSLGCRVIVDKMGNQFAIRPGKQVGSPTVAGSHLDTQPTGGRYDGILGITAGVEMLRCLADAQVETRFPVGVVNWTNEEGARFPISMVASGVWAGAIGLDDAHNLASIAKNDPPGTNMLSSLKDIGYLGDMPCSFEHMPLAAHFELHIEQGPILERSRKKIGIVEAVQAYSWFTISVLGREAHTGTTDLLTRSDALLAASKMIARARKTSWEMGGIATTGVINAKPGSTNTIAGNVSFSLDIRAKNHKLVKDIEERLRIDFASIAKGEYAEDIGEPQDQVSLEWHLDSDTPETKFSQDCVDCVALAAQDFASQYMVSGAGHDSVYTSLRAPTSMIFVPSKGGVSHNPEEYTAPEDCAIGAEVLLRSILEYDKRRNF